MKSFTSPQKNIGRLIQPKAPRKLKRQNAIITNHPDSESLKKIIMNKVKDLNLSNKPNLNNWLAIYKRNTNNNTNPEKEQYIPIFSNNLLNFNSINISNRYNTIFSGAFANVYTNVKNKNGNPLNVVIKKFKQKTLNNRVDTTLLDELYGAIMNLYIQNNLTLEEQIFFNKILGIYLVKKMMGVSTLQLVLEKCNAGDLITYFGNPYLATLDINSKCKIFHNLCYNALVMLNLLIKLKLVHLDIKIDNILVELKDGNITFKLSDFSTIRENKTKLKYKIGTDSYVSPLFLVDLNNKNAIAKHLYDFYSMAISLFNIFIVLFKINIRPSQYFPFTNEEYTFKSKFDIWNRKDKYEEQVNFLKTFLKKSFDSISIILGLTPKDKDILEKDIQIMEDLFLSNNPFPAPGQNMETETFAKIITYLMQNGLTPPSTN